jgi:NAD(P)H-dependent FMN reductase
MSHIHVVLGSTREGRFSEKPARWVEERLSARDDMSVELVDLRDYPLPMFDLPRSPAYTGRDYPSPEIERWGSKVDEADGFVFVMPEYNHGYSAVLKNAIDHAFVEWHRKPVAFVSYGNVGGARAVEQMRLVAVELEMAPLRHAVHVMPDLMLPAMQSDYDPEIFAPLDGKLDLLATDLAWWADSLAAARTGQSISMSDSSHSRSALSRSSA